MTHCGEFLAADDFLAPRWKKAGVSTAENWRAVSTEKTARRTMAR